jgi:hypothetical protein
MAKVAPPGAGQSRPFTLLFVCISATFAAAGFWFMRIQPALNDVPANMEQLMETGIPSKGTPWKTTYTGIASLDELLKLFVGAFLAGPLTFNRGIVIQQIHFIIQFLGVLCVWNVEACRQRNAYRAIGL